MQIEHLGNWSRECFFADGIDPSQTTKRFRIELNGIGAAVSEQWIGMLGAVQCVGSSPLWL